MKKKKTLKSEKSKYSTLDQTISDYIENVLDKKFEYIAKNSFLPVVTNTYRHLSIPISIKDDVVDIRKVTEKLQDALSYNSKNYTINSSETIESINLTEKIVKMLDLKGDIISFSNGMKSVKIKPTSLSSVNSMVFLSCRGFKLSDNIKVDYTDSEEFYMASRYYNEIFLKYSDFISNNRALCIIGFGFFDSTPQYFSLKFENNYTEEFDTILNISNLIRSNLISEVNFEITESYIKTAIEALKFIPNDKDLSYDINFVMDGKIDTIDCINKDKLLEALYNIISLNYKIESINAY
jgi:hypothetical protein